MLTPQEHAEAILRRLPPRATVTLPLLDAANCTLATNLTAPFDSRDLITPRWMATRFRLLSNNARQECSQWGQPWLQVRTLMSFIQKV